MKIIFFILIFAATVFANTQDDQVEDTGLKELASLVTEPLYQLKIEQIEKLLLSHLNNNQKYAGLVLIDEFDSAAKPTLSLWKKGYQKDTKNLMIYKRSIFHPKSKRQIGKLMLYKVPDDSTLFLTQEEIAYLERKKEITMCIDPDWMPFEKIQNGKHTGLTSEYIKLFAEKIKKPIILVETISWADSLEKAKVRECDILSLAAKTPEREHYMNFTSSYIEVPIVVATKTGLPFIEDLKQIQTKKLGVVRGYVFYETLKRKYPGINLIEVASAEDGLAKVQKDKIFGYLDSSVVINYEIQKNYIGILSISGKFQEHFKLGIATRNDEHALHSIFEKAVLSIDSLAKQRLLDKWVKVNYVIKTDYTLVWQVLLFALLIIVIVTYWNMRLKREIIKRHAAEAGLIEVNDTLEQRVAEKIEEIHHKELLLQQQSRLAQMGEMISMIAHQWRQPLSATSGATMAVQTKIRLKKYDLENLDEREKFEIYLDKKLKDIQRYVKVMTETIDDFRNFFKKERTQVYTDINGPIEKALQIIMPHLKIKDIVVVKQLDSMHHIPVYPSEVMQVIINLLKNAADAYDEKGPGDKKIIIHTYDSDKEVKVTLCDHAGGVPAAISERIFDPYFSTKLEKNGTGLGLYMSKMIIEDHHHGTLTLNDQEDGACFVLSFKINDIKEKS